MTLRAHVVKILSEILFNDNIQNKEDSGNVIIRKEIINPFIISDFIY